MFLYYCFSETTTSYNCIQLRPLAARQLRNKQCCKSFIDLSCRKSCADYFGTTGVDIHKEKRWIHLDCSDKDGSNFQFIHLGRSFTKAPKHITDRCEPLLLLLPPSKQDLRSASPPQRVILLLNERGFPTRGSYFSFMTECAKWKTNDLDFQTFRPELSGFHRIFALTKGFCFETGPNGVERCRRECRTLRCWFSMTLSQLGERSQRSGN
ncbi:hypothetical protein AVEN_133906-1 [Araneus ventricosus]|uniref:Uncharacterized protein n=1 Tax=Araneus ventricosus TaxID=182803 RepID=A0A4Y2D4D8_ARAVE|nr:hypothetical protein AVEN_133906-1 [Araneus ventricosus]